LSIVLTILRLFFLVFLDIYKILTRIETFNGNHEVCPMLSFEKLTMKIENDH